MQAIVLHGVCVEGLPGERAREFKEVENAQMRIMCL
jgi:hypothetical protein